MCFHPVLHLVKAKARVINMPLFCRVGWKIWSGSIRKKQPCVKYTLAKSSCCCFSSSSTGIPRFSKRWDLRLFLATALLYSLRALVPSLTMVPKPRFSRAVKACSGAIVLLLCFFSQISLASEDRRWINWVAHCVLKTKKNFPYTAYSILAVCLSRSRDYLPQLITAILESVINIQWKLDLAEKSVTELLSAKTSFSASSSGLMY